eukprot:TRINITY_DN8488_c0_g1_i2.p1 TRINITY_DN8488_c0_g1~~TRINITY_DN8488_c0_g1_i2.p1  ORF type:complete len:421 (+),score=105.90 TRINITY_DN8488_c0_g1_i2:309-1571(+)
MSGKYKEQGAYGIDSWRPVITFSKPTDVKQILNNIDEVVKRRPPPSISEAFRPIFGPTSISALNNPLWHDYRMILNKSFSNNQLFLEPIKSKALQCISLWKSQPSVAISPDVQKMALDVLGHCILGKDFNTLGGNTTGPLHAYNTIINTLFTPLVIFFPRVQQLPLPRFKKLLSAISEFDSYCWKIINQSKGQVSLSKSDTHLIELMVANGLPEGTVRDNVGTFFFAGHETTASTIIWACGLLATKPLIQQRLRQELADATDNGKRELGYEELLNLHYLDWFLKETMRCHPAVTSITTRSTKNQTVIGDWCLPADLPVKIDFISMLQDADIWGEDSLLFDPERWSPERITKAQLRAYMPFSSGPRVCMGKNFSLLEQKVFFYCLLKECPNIQLAPGGRLEVDRNTIFNVPSAKLLRLTVK